MKKLIASIVVFGILFTSSPAHALTLSDLQKEVERLRQESVSLRAMMPGQVLGVTASISYSLGMKSTDLIKYQQALIDQKYLAPGNATGVFGPLTYSAVKNFQTAKGLKADGVLGAQTQSLLTPILITEGQEPICVPNTWKEKAKFTGTLRHSAVGFAIGTKGYMGTGYQAVDQNGGLYLKDFWEWNQTNNTWTQKADFGGVPRSLAVGFSINGKGYVGTGEFIDHYVNGQTYSYKDFWEYNPVNNTWARKADFGGGNRYFATGFEINGKGYVGTGLTDGESGNGSDFWEYNPKLDMWTKKADFAGGARYAPTGFSINGKGYLGTGVIGNESKSDFWEYNPVTDKWIKKADIGGGGKSGGRSFVADGIGYVVNGGSVKSLWAYNPSTNTWTEKASPLYKLSLGIAFGIGKKGYWGLGSTSSYFAEYCPGQAN